MTRHRKIAAFQPQWSRPAARRAGYIGARVDEGELRTGIIPVHSRSPSLIARSIAPLDEMVPDGAVLELCPSSNPVIEQLHGMEFQPTHRRQPALRRSSSTNTP